MADEPANGHVYPDAESHQNWLLQPTQKLNAPLKPPTTGPAKRAAETKSGIGISCSGGGIRSAAYNLGTLQALNEAGVLGRADYLSAVSGGSYITSAYAMAARHSDPALLGGDTKEVFRSGSVEEQFVRNRSSYLAEGVGGKLRLIASVLIGLLCNVVFLAFLLYALARPLGWLLSAVEPSFRIPEGCKGRRCFPTPNWGPEQGLLKITLGLGGLGVFLALFSRMFHPPARFRRGAETTGKWLVSAAVAFGFVLVLLPELVVLARDLGGAKNAPNPTAGTLTDTSTRANANVGILTTLGFGTVAVTTILQLGLYLRQAFTVGKAVVEGATKFAKINAALRKALLYIAGALVGPLSVLGVIVLIMNDAAISRSPSTGEWTAWAIVVGVFMAIWWLADVTSWSMHPFYKRRVASAFAVKRAKGAGDKPVAVEVDFQQPLALAAFKPSDMQVPFPEVLVCAAANVSDRGLTPPGARVTSFVFSPTRIGGPVVGSMDTEDYCKRVGKRRQLDVTLSAAVAMSGAAIAPSMGKMTIAPLRMLLALANVRLGVWMPNPARLSDTPRFLPRNPRPIRLLFEVIGRNRLSSRYLYVSDGGHYENLGLVELIRRGCTQIYCFDAAGGTVDRYSTLGEAIALARAELQVEIDIDPTPMRPKREFGVVPASHVVGTIRYPDPNKPDGKIVFVKAASIEDMPWDVRAYGEKDHTFPTDSTAKQLYTGERFEAYRALGYSAAQLALKSLPPPPAARPAKKAAANRK